MFTMHRLASKWSQQNLTPENYKLTHFTYKLLPQYLAKCKK